MYRAGPPSPAQSTAAATLRDALVADHLANDPTAAQRVILDLLVFAKARHADVANYLMGMPRPWVDRRSRRAWRITHDLSQLERHIARLTTALVDPVLERRPKPIESVKDYVARKDAERATVVEPALAPAVAPEPEPRPEEQPDPARSDAGYATSNAVPEPASGPAPKP